MDARTLSGLPTVLRRLVVLLLVAAVALLAGAAGYRSDVSPVRTGLRAEPTSGQALDLYLKIDGVLGDATQSAHLDEIVIDSLQTAVNSSSGKKPAFVPVQLAKGVDRSSPLLMKAALAGTVFPQARIQAWGPSASGDGTSVLHEQWLLEGVSVRNPSMSVSGGGSSDTFSLDFAKLTYTHYRPGGQSVGVCWDAVAQVTC